MIENVAIISSAAVPVTPNDSLRIQFNYALPGNGNANVRLTQIDTSGNVINTVETIPLLMADNIKTTLIALTDGQFISASIDVNGSAIAPGRIYCQIGILRGSVAANANVIKLTAGYVADGQFLNFPGTLPLSPRATYSPNTILTGIAPAAGAQNADEFLGPSAYRLIDFVAQLTTNATVINRRVRFQFEADGVIVQSGARTDQTAGQIRIYHGWRGGSIPDDDTTNGIFYIALPEGTPEGPLQIQSITTNMQAGDQWATASYTVQRQIAI